MPGIKGAMMKMTNIISNFKYVYIFFFKRRSLIIALPLGLTKIIDDYMLVISSISVTASTMEYQYPEKKFK